MTLDAAALTLAMRQHRVVATHQLLELGLTRKQIEGRVARGVLVPELRRVWRIGLPPLDFEGRAVAAVLWCPDSIVSHRTAGALWGLRGLTRSTIDLTTPSGNHSRGRTGIKIRRIAGLDESDVVERDDGIRVASPLLTLYGLAAVLPAHALDQAFHDARHRELATLAEARDFLTRHRVSGRNGTRRFEAMLHRFEPLDRPNQSGLEVALRQAVEQLGLPTPVAQHPVALPGGVVIHLDHAFVDALLAVEVDHSWWHDTKRQRALDRERDRALRQMGWEVLRFDEDELADVMACAGIVAAAYHRRAPVRGRRA